VATDPLGELVRQYLVAQGIVRRPEVAAPTWDLNLPPLWVDLSQGIPAPGDLNPPNRAGDAVVAVNVATGLPSRRMETELRVLAREVWLRTKSAPRAERLYTLLRRALDDKRGWVMSGLWMSETKEIRPLQPLSTEQGVYTFNAEYTFEFRDSDLVV